MRAFSVVLVLAWLLGIILGVAGVSPVVVILVSLATGFIGSRVRQSVQVATVAAVLVCLGFVWGDSGGGWRGGDCKMASPVRVTVIGQPQIQAQWVLAVVEDERGCRMLVSADRFSELGEGDVVELAGGEVQYLDKVREYSVGYAGYLERRGISATWRYPSTNVVQGGKSWVQPLHTKIRERVTSLFVEPDASVVLAVLFAEKGTLPKDLTEAFRATGVSHVLAISGLHISLLTGMLLAVLMLLPLSSYVRTAVIVAWLWSYIIFIGWPTSAVRAAAFWTISLAALQLHVLVSLPTVLLLAVSVIVLFDPLLLTDIGFQLSVGAVIGIFLALFLARGLPRWGGPANSSGKLVGSALVSLGATVATGPIVVYHFGNVALSGIVTNLLVVPFIPALLILVIVALLLSLVFMPAALLVAFVVHGIVAWLEMVTSFISTVPGLFYEEVQISMWLIALYYLIIAVVCGVILRYQKRSWREIWQ